MTTTRDRPEAGNPTTRATSHEPPTEGTDATAPAETTTPASRGDAGARHDVGNEAATTATGAGGPEIEGPEHQGRPEPATTSEPVHESPRPAGRAGQLAVV